MPNYQNGKIYAIRSHQTDKIYVGSTCKKYLSGRMSGHLCEYKRYLDADKFTGSVSYEILTHGDAYIELLESYPCDTKDELLSREGHYIRTLDCVNKNIAGRTAKQYNEDNRDKLKKQRKEYEKKNRVKICDQKKKWVKDNIERIGPIVKEYQKGYRVDNKEKLNKYSSNYYETNKKEQLAKMAKHYQANKEEKRKKVSEHYKANRDRINARRRELARLKKDKKD